jgi:glycosyltransferase involved in cell wall biosynthesis
MNRGDAPFPSMPDGPHAGAPSVLTYVHGTGPGGVERIALRLVAGWRRDGMAVRLILGDGAGAGRWRTIAMAAALVRAIRAERPDILFCPGNSYTLIACLVKLRLRGHCPPIVAKISNDLVRRDLPWPKRAGYALWLRVQGRLIDRFAALSAPMAAETMRRMAVARGRVDVLPNPVLSAADLAAVAAERPRVPAAGRRFVAVGRLERQKNYPLMLCAFADGAGPDDRLTIFGTGRAGAALAREGAALGLAERVRFAGHGTDILSELRRHDVLLLSSLYEGQPGVVIEALACGLAIVATRCCAGMSHLLDGGALGLMVPPGDRAALAQAIRTVRPALQDRRRAHARAALFTTERAVPAYRALFARITATAMPADRPVPSPPFRMEAAS